jgi:hypothetical protein
MMDTQQAEAPSGWKAFLTLSQAGRATTRASRTLSLMTLRVRFPPCATTGAAMTPKSA